MNEELNQLIRMAQVLRVRAGNLSREMVANNSTGAAEGVRAAANLTRDAEELLKRAERTLFTRPE